MLRFGITAPKEYWNAEYASGSLVRTPTAVLGRLACFPVGRHPDFYARGRHSSVTGTLIVRDRRMWEVTAPDGTVDVMPEWSLLCGLKQHEELYPARARAAMAVYAVCGTAHDEIVHDPLELPARIKDQGPFTRST